MPQAVDPQVRRGRPKIVGTGVTVMRIAGWYKMGRSPEEIVAQYGHINLPQVHAALTYYHANTEEIEADIAAEDEIARALRERNRGRERRSASAV